MVSAISVLSVRTILTKETRGVGKAVTPEEYETYLEELAVFRDWFSDFVMGPDSDTLSSAILIMPYGEADPEYRDDPSP
jgi:hypothetical protein